ncbi:hypothetical protein HYPSUDRAFT_202294 [Hypholoma sublateritium FD-334 SS-4]|uniref:3'-5' exonuclease domain-containing protein n=1 Tax=Hypholoma sublateritium (strain FD-334 SS-4) TaxID=945553 RepID=A0A0D2L5Y9_HYPSF|nr:hypothetical protein HYPSUDRAFT_202294 [Hypholoma sublateritium FD-334 SS-4]
MADDNPNYQTIEQSSLPAQEHQIRKSKHGHAMTASRTTTKPRKQAIIGPKRPRGRPRKEKSNTADVPAAKGLKRPVGRPRKQHKEDERVIIDFGAFVVPGTRSQEIISSIPASSLAQHTAQTGPLRIIPDEDPDRPVDDGDGAYENDNDNDGDGNGVGSEDDEADVNEDDDSGDEGNMPTPRRQRQRLPAWLMRPFKAHVDASQSKFRDAKGLPPLYSKDARLSFHRPSTLFLLNHPQLSPEMDEWIGKQYPSFLPFNDTSTDGPRNFVPSAQWLRDLYDMFIEEHQQDFNQHMALLSAEITKHIATVNGERVFTALLTVTNQNGQIRDFNLVATKSHSQFECALVKIRQSLLMYGHLQPYLFYTDNMGDKAFLESCFPSLREGVVPIEKHGNLEPFSIPEDVEVLVKDEASSINAALSTILDDIPIEESEPDIVVGFDAEWNVTVGDWGNHTRGEVSVIQIAYERRVYILQISRMLIERHLPEKLIMLLSNPRIRKAGRMVASDLKYLESSLDDPPPFLGALDLAVFARDHHVVPNAKIGLADLCATVLQKQLAKNVSERVSSAWEERTLTPAQIRYAACDAYAPLLIYEKLSTIPAPSVLPEALVPGTPVLLYGTDQKIIAHGILSEKIHQQYDAINLTPTRILVDIEHVQIPAAKLSTHNNRELSSFGNVPFKAVCRRSHLRIYNPDSQAFFLPDIRVHLNPMALAQSNDMDIDLPAITSNEASNQDNQVEGSMDLSDESGGVGDLVGNTNILDSGAGLGEAAGIQSTHTRDPESAQHGEETMGSIEDNKWDDNIRSRVLKDIFHVFNMLRILTVHGLRNEFARALRDGIFIPDKEDRARVAAYGATLQPPMTFEELRASKPTWLWRHCKRVIPPPKKLYPLVQDIFLTYGPLKDATTGLPLFAPQQWQSSKQILELIRQGFVSDPPGIPLYTCIGVDSKACNLPIYRCFRGTNFTEGGVHTHLRSKLPTSGASIRHVNASMLDFVLRHNLCVGTYNETGQAYQGHYDIWLTNSLQELLVFVEDLLINPTHITGWVNGNLYTPTTETIGIISVPPDVREASGMTEYNPNLDHNRKHHYLASKQGTRKAILPVHTPAEHALFKHLMKTNDAFGTRSKGPIWPQCVQVWNTYADTQEDVYYKLTEQLKTYHAHWMVTLNVKQSKSLSSVARHSVNEAARATMAAVFMYQPMVVA